MQAHLDVSMQSTCVMCHQTIEHAHLKLQAAARLSVQHQHCCVSQGMNA